MIAKTSQQQVSPEPSREKRIYATTLIGSAVNLLLTAGKIVAGVLGQSGAMMADGLHSLSDLVSDFIVLALIKVSSKKQDADHNYGHGKYETMAAVCIGILLLFVSIELLSTGCAQIYKVIKGEPLAAPSAIALWAALTSIASKEALYQYTVRVGHQVKSNAVIANAWHHRTDALSSVCSAIGIGCAILFGGFWTILDPIACCGISLFILYIAFQMMLPALKELLEVSLPLEMEQQILQIARQVEGVEDIHALKTRRNGPSIIIEAHLVVSPFITIVEGHDIASKVERRLKEEFGPEVQVGIHIEPYINAE